MKKSLLALAFIAAVGLNAAPAFAGVIATTPNASKGTIRLHNTQGVCPATYNTVQTVLPSGEYLDGCWRYSRTDDDLIEAYYENGERYNYTIANFRTTEYGDRMGYAKKATPSVPSTTSGRPKTHNEI